MGHARVIQSVTLDVSSASMNLNHVHNTFSRDHLTRYLSVSSVPLYSPEDGLDACRPNY